MALPSSTADREFPAEMGSEWRQTPSWHVGAPHPKPQALSSLPTGGRSPSTSSCVTVGGSLYLSASDSVRAPPVPEEFLSCYVGTFISLTSKAGILGMEAENLV